MRSLLLTIVLSAVIAAGVGYTFGAKTQTPETLQPKESAFDRVIKSGKLRCGYVVVPPSLSRDPNTGELSGISYDIVSQLAKDIGLTVEWAEEVSFATMAEALKNDRFDMVCSVVWSGSERGKVSRFTIPLYYSAINAYARADDTRFPAPALMNSADMTIATIDGSTAASIARENFPLAKTYSLPDMTDFSQLMVAVTDRKADFTFSEGAQAAKYLAKNPGTVRNITPDQPLRVFPNRFCAKLGEDKLIQMIDNGLQNLLNSGFIDRTLDKFADPTAYRRVSKSYQ